MVRQTLCLMLFCLPAAAGAADWPGWLGPDRNGSSPEKGLLTDWSAKKPTVLWKEAGGDGYSSIAVVGDTCYTLIQNDAEYAVAHATASGKRLWKTKIGPFFKNSYGNGPRSTPAIEGDRVYVQSVSGNFACLNAKSGDIVWQKDLLTTFKAKNISWGLSSSPVIEGDMVLAIPGGAGAAVVALNKKTGDVVWQTGSDKAAYSTPQPVTVAGKRQILVFTAARLLAVDAAKGESLWDIPWKTEFDCNIVTPLVVGDKVFIASGENVGCGLFTLSAAGAPTPDWRFKAKKSPMTNYWANAMHHNGHLYGISGQFDAQLDLNCVELKTGKLKWSKADFGKASLTLADGHLFIVTKSGDLVLVEANPEKYVEKGRLEKFIGESRTQATLADGRLYLRDLTHLYCVDIRGK